MATAMRERTLGGARRLPRSLQPDFEFGAASGSLTVPSVIANARREIAGISAELDHQLGGGRGGRHSVGMQLPRQSRSAAAGRSARLGVGGWGAVEERRRQLMRELAGTLGFGAPWRTLRAQFCIQNFQSD
eukprot:SAG11_NODE_816_length_7030_cov_15.673784_6_plen_131_part_00